MDLLYLGAAILLFAATWALLAFLDRL